jgi:hypothetical protein
MHDEWAAAAVIRWQCRHDRYQLFRWYTDGGGGGADAPPRGHHADRRYVRSVRWRLRHWRSRTSCGSKVLEATPVPRRQQIVFQDAVDAIEDCASHLLHRGHQGFRRGRVLDHQRSMTAIKDAASDRRLSTDAETERSPIGTLLPFPTFH